MTGTTALIIYAGLGLLFVCSEHFSYDWSLLDEMTPLKVAFNIAHQLIHYTRCLIVWPWYVVEDLLIIAGDRLFAEDEDEGPPDDGVVG